MKTFSFLFFVVISLTINAQDRVMTPKKIKKFRQQEVITHFNKQDSVLQTIEPISDKVYISREYKVRYFSPILNWQKRSFAVIRAHIEVFSKSEKIPFLEKLDHKKWGIEKEKRTIETSLALRETYSVETDPNKQAQLVYQGNPLLTQYDSIWANRAFVIAYKKGKYDIYNLSLVSLAKGVTTYAQEGAYIGYIKKHQIYRTGMEGISNKNYTIRGAGLCCDIETPFSSEYFLEKDSLNNPIILEKVIDYLETPEREYDVIYHFNEKDKFDSIVWLDGSYKSVLERHQHYSVMVISDLLLVTKDNKKAIAYPLLDYEKKEINLVYITDFEYDSVIYTDAKTPLVLHKEQQKFIAHFPNWNDFRFDKNRKAFQVLISEPFKEIEMQGYFFVRYVRENGKKGWYNIKQNKTYDD